MLTLNNNWASVSVTHLLNRRLGLVRSSHSLSGWPGCKPNRV